MYPIWKQLLSPLCLPYLRSSQYAIWPVNIIDGDPDPYRNLGQVEIICETSPALSLADQTKPPGMGKECLSHSHHAVRSQDHGLRLEKTCSPLLQKRSSKRELCPNNSISMTRELPNPPAKLPPQPPGFWTQIKSWMLVFKYVECSDLATASIDGVPIPISLLLIYPTYESTSIFHGSYLATSLSVLMANGKSRVQEQVPIPHQPKYSPLVLSISNPKIYLIININKTYLESLMCIIKGSKFKTYTDIVQKMLIEIIKIL